MWFEVAPFLREENYYIEIQLSYVNYGFYSCYCPCQLTIYWPLHLFYIYFLKWLLLVLIGMYAPIWIRLQKVVYFNTSSYSLSKTLLRSVRNMVLETFVCLGRMTTLVIIAPFTWLRDFPVPKSSFNTTWTSVLIDSCKLVGFLTWTSGLHWYYN